MVSPASCERVSRRRVNSPSWIGAMHSKLISNWKGLVNVAGLFRISTFVTLMRDMTAAVEGRVCVRGRRSCRMRWNSGAERMEVCGAVESAGSSWGHARWWRCSAVASVFCFLLSRSFCVVLMVLRWSRAMWRGPARRAREHRLEEKSAKPSTTRMTYKGGVKREHKNAGDMESMIETV